MAGSEDGAMAKAIGAAETQAGADEAWMQASGRRQRSWTASGAMAKATAQRGSVTAGGGVIVGYRELC